jgi:hypothetical protein
MAGDDFVARAKNSWDISATNKDGRLKAKNNLWLTATGATGGILIESKATAGYTNASTGEAAVHSGVIIKADNAKVALASKDLAFKVIEQEDATSTLVFDVGWSGKIRFRSKYVEHFIAEEGGIMDFWVGTGAGESVDNYGDDCELC